MSRNGTRLPIEPGSLLERALAEWVNHWPIMEEHWTHPRSRWLGQVEQRIALAFPDASSADLRLTARSLAPFPLADGHDVP